jgi:branched-subunit amino acid aminotransferase/4-amino-4-deoxychorismate lyase
MKVEERKISVKELVEALQEGRVKEAFGAGTAATIAHIELIGHEGKDYPITSQLKSVSLRIRFTRNWKESNAAPVRPIRVDG